MTNVEGQRDIPAPAAALTTPMPVVVYSRMWRSGTGLYAQGVAMGIAKAGHPTIFIAPAGEPADTAATVSLIRRIRPPRELIEAVSASRMRRAIVSGRRVAEGLWALCTQGIRVRRVIITIPDPLIFSIWPIMILRALGCRILFICHDPQPHAWRLPKTLRWLERAGHAACYHLATQLVVLASTAKQALISGFGIDPAKISIIPHGAFDVASVGPLPASRRLLLFGTIRRNKQVHMAIAAVARARASGCDVWLHIAGGVDANDPEYLDECRQVVERCAGAVTLEVGYISDPRMMELLGCCDAVLLPYSQFDSQSGVAVLAGMAGRPVIATRAGGIPDLVEAGLAAISIPSPAGETEIAQAIVDFYTVPANIWNERAASGRQTLSRALDWRSIGARLATLLD
jgi:glycogen(starch) synthase